MNAGECVLTYNWGDGFKQSMEEGSQLREPGRLGVLKVPGSTQVLDRDTMKLVDCDADLCRHGDYHEDIGWVNRAPYMAFGGWVSRIAVISLR
jgi:multiple sugar transport system substrate-binding protein